MFLSQKFITDGEVNKRAVWMETNMSTLLLKFGEYDMNVLGK
jgi:hypothetical protein